MGYRVMTRCTVPLLSACVGRKMKRIYRTAEPCGFNVFNHQWIKSAVPNLEYDEFCKELVDLDEAVVAAFVISDEILGSHIKLSVPVLKEEDEKRLSKQTLSVMEIVKSNERLFGRLDFVLVRHEAIDGMFFPVDNQITVLLGLMKPYDHDNIEQTVRAKIDSRISRKKIDSI